MKFGGIFLISSIIVLLGSIYIYHSVDLETHNSIKIYGSRITTTLVLELDSIFKYCGYPGFYRRYEDWIANYIFSKVNRSGMIIERMEFDGVEVFTFDPEKHEKNRPAILYFHGGGWTYFDPKLYSHMTAEMSRRLNILVVSVNYRRAPEYPFPIPANDALTAAKYFFKNAEKFDVDPKRIALMGDSAGGNLVMVVGYQLALLAKADKNQRVPKVIVPLCPVFQMADITLPSFRRENRDKIVFKAGVYLCYCSYAFGDLPRNDMKDCMSIISTNSHLSEEAVAKIKDNIDWKKYLKGDDYDNVPKSTFKYSPNKFTKRFSELVSNPLISPLSALSDSELAILPPVYILTALLDPLRDEGKLMAARLSKAGRLGEYKEFDHYHVSFLLAPFGAEKSQKAFNDIMEFFEGKKIL